MKHSISELFFKTRCLYAKAKQKPKPKTKTLLGNQHLNWGPVAAVTVVAHPTSGESDGLTRRLCCPQTQGNPAVFFLEEEPLGLFSWRAAIPPLNPTLIEAARVAVTASCVKGYNRITKRTNERYQPPASHCHRRRRHAVCTF